MQFNVCAKDIKCQGAHRRMTWQGEVESEELVLTCLEINTDTRMRV